MKNMDEKDFNSQVTAEVSAESMLKIYARLENETTPHAARVSKCRPYIKRVVIYCDAKDYAHFNNIVGNEHKTKI